MFSRPFQCINLDNQWKVVDGVLDAVIDVGWNPIAGPIMLIMYAFGHLIGWLTRNVMQPLMSWQPFQIFAVVIACILAIFAVVMFIVCFFEILKWLLIMAFAGFGFAILWSVGRILLKMLVLLLMVVTISWLVYRGVGSLRNAVSSKSSNN